MSNLFLDDDLARLRENGARRRTEPDFDPTPVLKLFTPDAGATWLLTEIDPDDPDLAYGLCDLGVGFPELGSVRLSEIHGVRGALGLTVERDRSFTARFPVSEYARLAARLGGIDA